MQVPRDIRICRAVRDIPTKFIHGGCMTPNLRQIATERIEMAGSECQDIRSREIGRRPGYKLDDAIYTTTYLTGNDVIIMAESWDRRALFGFLRLRFNNYNAKKNIIFKELCNYAIVQELHVYSAEGMLVKVGDQKKGATQHCGVGKTLVNKAEWMAMSNGNIGVKIISGFGVRNYYRKLGYELQPGKGEYMSKTFSWTLNIPLFVVIMIIFITLYYV